MQKKKTAQHFPSRTYPMRWAHATSSTRSGAPLCMNARACAPACDSPPPSHPTHPTPPPTPPPHLMRRRVQHHRRRQANAPPEEPLCLLHLLDHGQQALHGVPRGGGEGVCRCVLPCRDASVCFHAGMQVCARRVCPHLMLHRPKKTCPCPSVSPIPHPQPPSHPSSSHPIPFQHRPLLPHHPQRQVSVGGVRMEHRMGERSAAQHEGGAAREAQRQRYCQHRRQYNEAILEKGPAGEVRGRGVVNVCRGV
jgi:hypothetical protein